MVNLMKQMTVEMFFFILLLSVKITIFSNMENHFPADHIAVTNKKGFPCSWFKYTSKYFMKFDVKTEVSFTFRSLLIES